MAVRVSPTENDPTHHICLKNREGKELGLLICDDLGKPKDLWDAGIFIENPVTTTAFKQTSGASSYDIFDYPYSPIVQDDLSGGRGGKDFERDATKYFDSFRCNSGRANKAYNGPLEQYAEGLRTLNQSMPGSVDFISLTDTNRYIYKRFQASGNYTAGKVWSLLRYVGKPKDLTIAIYADSANSVGSLLESVTVAYTDMNDTLSEWLNETISEALTNGTYYWLVIYAGADNTKNHWKVAVKEDVGTTYASNAFATNPTAADFDLYFRTTPAEVEQTCIMFEYKEQMYFVVSGASGAPKIYMAGDRGAADANTGQLNKLIDATKSWVTDEHVGSPVLIIDGPGRLEKQTWRVATANDTNSLTLDSSWTIEHTTATEYVILGKKLKEITGHGLTAPVTDVLVSPTGVIYFCMGSSVTVRRLRAFNDSGTWKDFDHADCKADETSTTKADFMVYKPIAKKIVIGVNQHTDGTVTTFTMSNASVPAWGTALTWDAARPVDNVAHSRYNKITGMIVHPDSSGNEVVWVFKTDGPYILPATGDALAAGLEEMRAIRSNVNGANPLRHDVYLYFPLLRGYQRWYGGQFTDMGPNLGEPLPENRRGAVVASVGYPGKFFVAIDAGASGYSSVVDSGGWHERYRAPKGQRIKALYFQNVAGTTLDRLWIFQGNDLVWLPFPSDSTNELEDDSYEYVYESAVETAWMHAGMYDVQKLVKFLKIQSESLEVDATTGKPICWIELDYRLNADDWQTWEEPLTTSPTETADFSDIYGLAGERIKFRVRMYTRDKSKTPIFLALMVFAVLRVDMKYQWGPFTFLFEDKLKAHGLREEDSELSAAKKLELFKAFGDATNNSMLEMKSVSALLDGKMVFLNIGSVRQVRFKRKDGNEWTSDAYVVSGSFQEA